MFNFVVGLALGWLAGNWYARNGGSGRVPLEEARRRASGAIQESERIVEETKRELQAAVQGGAGGRVERPRTQRRSPRRRGKSEGPAEND